jgi:isopenicillin-N N-acyltransferase like protein
MQSKKISASSIRIVILFIAFSCLQRNGLYAQQATTANAADKKNVPVIELSGNAYERGLQHGKQLKVEIASVFIKWKNNIRAAVSGDPDSLLTAFLKTTNFEPITRKYIPEIMDELKGISEGSGQNFNDVYAFQLVDEFWVYLDKQFNSKNHHCSGLGVPASANHPAYIAQNIDLESYMNGYQVLLHIAATKKEPEQYVISCAGLVGLSGMNEKGIGVCVNTLMELQASADGLPVAFIIRGILNKQNGNDALAFLKTVKHASGQNYILGITDSVYDFEASANQVIRFLPKEQSSVVYHTNHALVNHDVKEWYVKYHEKVLAGQTKKGNSEVRFASLENYLNKLSEEISPEIIKNTLRSKDNALNPVCRPFKEGAGFTFSSVVFTLGWRRSVQITYGSPDLSEYREYFFNKLNN